MAKVHKIDGYDEFKQKIDELAKTAENVNVLFSGKKDAAGHSWCPDCNDGTCILQFKHILDFSAHQIGGGNSVILLIFVCMFFSAEPVVNKYCIEQAVPNSIFVLVDVGDRPT